MQVNVSIVNAFVDDGQGGNPAGVVLMADALSTAQKQSVARQLGLSEVAFVSASNKADFKLDFFTPQRQIAHCGHATIATFSLLAQKGRIPQPDTSKETIDGVCAVQVSEDQAFMAQRAPRYTTLDSDITTRVLLSLGLAPSQMMASPMVVDTGNRFLLLGVSDIATLEAITPDQEVIRDISEALDLIGFYLFTTTTYREGRDATARMFAPRFGIDEESATGMAAGPLACYLHDQLECPQATFMIEQGYAMLPASPSCIDVRLTCDAAGRITGLRAGGRAQVSHERVVELDD